MGLVNKVVPVDELDAVAEEWGRRLAAGPTLALGLSKRLLDAELVGDLRAGARGRGALPAHHLHQRGHARRDQRLPRASRAAVPRVLSRVREAMLEAGLVGRDERTLCSFYTGVLGFALVDRLEFDVGTVCKLRRGAARLKIFFPALPWIRSRMRSRGSARADGATPRSRSASPTRWTRSRPRRAAHADAC